MMKTFKDLFIGEYYRTHRSGGYINRKVSETKCAARYTNYRYEDINPNTPVFSL